MSEAPSEIEQALRSAMADHQAGRFERARSQYEAILARQPAHARALHALGVLEKTLGNTERAVERIARAIELHPDAAEFHNNLGDALRTLGRLDDAVAAFERAIARSPAYFKAYNNLGLARLKQGRYGDAIDAFGRAVSIRPDYAIALANLGTALTQCGRQEEAIESFRRALQSNPNYVTAHSSMLMGLNYLDLDPPAVFAAHREWAVRHADPLTAAAAPHAAERPTDRPLRIGYVSGDFSDHAVAMFFMAALRNRDRQRFHVTCYSNLVRPDAVTNYLQQACDAWREIANVPDDAAAEIVRRDHIDLLVDLSGHSAKNRLLLLARRPAPVQATWLGYPNTTGMTAIDFRLTDALADPPGQTESLHTERLVRLRSNWCYAAPAAAPDVVPPPAADGTPVTFGSFNTLAKASPAIIRLWADVLRATPGSRMMIKSNASGDPAVQDRLRQQFASHGVAPERLILLGREPDPRRHLERYGEVDVMLDTYPYHGTTMTCEALWMGVPVVTLMGRSHVARVGVSLLTSVGLAELIAPAPQQYVEIAAALAADLPRLTILRQGMRPRMAASPLLDQDAFVRDLESAYLRMWTRDAALQ